MKPDFARRQKTLRGLMEKNGLDAIMTSDANDIFYYTGYSGLKDDRIFMLFPADAKPKLAVSSLENEAGLFYKNVVYIHETEDFLEQLKQFKRLGYDERSLNLLLFQEMQKNLKSKLEPSGKIMEMPRIIKDAYEIEQLKTSISITGKVLRKIGSGLAGRSEKKIADAIDIEFKKMGCESAFEPIVCSGAQTAFVHHKPNERLIKANDIVQIDLGCRFNGYCCDVTRVLFRKMDARHRKIYEDVRQIHDEIIHRLSAGVEYKDVAEFQQKIFKKNGYKVSHSFGHGLGLSVHEAAGEVLKENSVLTVEPGVYIKNFGGFRIEDVVVVKKNKADVLSKPIPIL